MTHLNLCKREGGKKSPQSRLVFQPLSALIISITRSQPASHCCSCPGFDTAQACSAESATRHLKFHFVTAFTISNFAAEVRLCLTKLQHKPLLYLSTDSRPTHLCQLTSQKQQKNCGPAHSSVQLQYVIHKTANSRVLGEDRNCIVVTVIIYAEGVFVPMLRSREGLLLSILLSSSDVC